MKILVVDSSVIVKWLNQQKEKHLDRADKILNDLKAGRAVLIAPELAKYEIGNALLIRKQLQPAGAAATFDTLYNLPIQFIPDSKELANETYKLAQSAGITYYDACFITLAKQEGAVLVTDNPKHQAKTKAVNAIALKDY